MHLLKIEAAIHPKEMRLCAAILEAYVLCCLGRLAFQLLIQADWRNLLEVQSPSVMTVEYYQVGPSMWVDLA